MPIYQYQCSECGHGLEALQKMSDPKLVDCPECAEPALKKQLTAAAFKLKGTGWYETDFKNSGKKPEAANKSSDHAADIPTNKANEDASAPSSTSTSSAKESGSNASVAE